MLVLLFLTACKEEPQTIIEPDRFIVKIQEKQKSGVSEYAEVIYKPSMLDTLELKEGDFREVTFSYIVSNRRTFIKELEKMELDYHYAALKNQDSIIPLRIKIDTVGNFFIEGFVRDSIAIKSNSNTDQFRIITSKVKVSEKIEIVNEL